jgi:PTEN phosphatase family protein
MNASRHLVSQNKRRFVEDGFDLDLTYVTERVIAMSFPSTGKQGLYRNPIKEVVRLLDTRHRGRYKVYNLCSEKSYDSSYFHGQVERIKIDDHTVPPLLYSSAVLLIVGVMSHVIFDIAEISYVSVMM